MNMRGYIQNHQHCEGGDCNSCPRWRKCVKEYLDHLVELMRKKKLDK
ncbi:hypothetical protein ES703_54001 [subsurface metagenome]